MLVALDSLGIQRISFKENKEELRKLSKSKELCCPYCERLVFFHGGEKRIHHFNHEPHVECTFTGEPETQEHLNGKQMIYEWLKRKYPQAEVSLEKRIIETNQIADVYLAFENGQRFAFEIQCAELTAGDWSERRKLYRKANIRDIWLFGKKYYKELVEGEDLNTKNEKVLSLKHLQQEVNRKDRSVYFIDSHNWLIRQIGSFFQLTCYSETRYIVEVQEMSIKDLGIIKVQSPCGYMLADQHTIKKIEFYFIKRTREAQSILKGRMEEKQQLEKRHREFENYKEFLASFILEKALQKMSLREQIIFKRLIKEYGFTDENFPGIFTIQLENHHYIETPYPLWQLLVFHKAVKHNTSKKKLIFPPYFFQDIKGDIRYKVKNSKCVAGLIFEYLEVLESCGFIRHQSYTQSYKHPFAIENDVLSKMEDKTQNSLLSMHFSEFNMGENLWEGEPVDSITEELKIKMREYRDFYRYLVTNQID